MWTDPLRYRCYCARVSSVNVLLYYDTTAQGLAFNVSVFMST